MIFFLHMNKEQSEEKEEHNTDNGDIQMIET